MDPSIVTVVAGPVVLAAIGGIGWVFMSMRADKDKEIERLNVANIKLQDKLDTVLTESLANTKVQLETLQKRLDLDHRQTRAMETNNKVIEGLAAVVK